MPWAGPVPGGKPVRIVGWSGYKQNVTTSVFGTWSLLAAVIAGFIAETAEPEKLAEALKLAITPLAVAQGLSVYVLRGATKNEKRRPARARRRYTARELAVTVSSWSATYSIILILAFLVIEISWLSNTLGPLAAAFTVWSLLSISRLGSMREAIEQYRRMRKKNRLQEDAVWDGRVTARIIDALLMAGIASAIVALAVSLGALGGFDRVAAYRVSLVLGAAYEMTMLARRGSTLGKTIARLRVHYVGDKLVRVPSGAIGLGYRVAAIRAAGTYLPLGLHASLYLLPIDSRWISPVAQLFFIAYFLFPPQIHPNGRSIWDVIAATQVRRYQGRSGNPTHKSAAPGARSPTGQ